MSELRSWYRTLRDAGGWATCWALTTVLAFAGAMMGVTLVIGASDPVPFVDSLARIDGRSYKLIATEGYQYTPRFPSSVAFFPAFPLCARLLSESTGIGIVGAELVVSNCCCFGAFGIMSAYLRERFVRDSSDNAPLLGPENGARVRDYALLSMAVLPTTFFFRMAYTESMFLFLAILVLYGICRRWPAILVASVVGLATAVRPVGVCLLGPLYAYLWRRATSRTQAVRRAALYTPIGCWGLLAYMAFLGFRFGQPFAFALTQRFHRMRPEGALADQVLALASWEPIRDVYDRSSLGYWQALHFVPSRLFSLEFANPIYLIGTAALVALGAWRRWLTRDELILAVPLLLIPYLTRAYEMRMLSQARFAAVVFPAYIVMAQLLARLPRIVAVSVLALFGFMMGTYAALFAAGYPFL
jgi:hypothetical protein